MFTVPVLAVVATWLIVTELVVTELTYPATVEAAAVEFVGENMQYDEAVTPVIVKASEVAVVYVPVPRTVHGPPPSSNSQVPELLLNAAQWPLVGGALTENMAANTSPPFTLKCQLPLVES